MAKGDPISSPWTYQASDHLQRMIRGTFSFNNVTRALTGLVVFRDVNCDFTKIYIGVGPDGTPDTVDANHVFVIPDGTTNINPAQMSARGFTTIESVLATQITAGP